MNPLEQEYRLNVQRAKDRELSRVYWIYGGGSAAVLVGLVGFAIAATDWNAPDASRTLGMLGQLFVCALSPLAAVAALAAGIRVAKWHADRNVVVSTTERERSYRAPMDPTNASVVSPSPWRRVVRAIVLAALSLAAVTQPGFGARLTWSERGVLGLVLAFAVGSVVLIKGVYATWRSRRNARLQLKWDRWLESADSCKVRAREWTE